jgi:arylsulfatase A-like enzyme
MRRIRAYAQALTGLAVTAAVLLSLLPSAPAQAPAKKPNILVIFGDDIGQTNISAYSMGLMGYRTPNIDRIAKEGMMFTDYYAENSCTAGRSTFITGQVTLRTGLSKVGIPGAPVGLQARDITIAQALKPLGYATGQFGKNHLGDRNEFLPTAHGFDPSRTWRCAINLPSSSGPLPDHACHGGIGSSSLKRVVKSTARWSYQLLRSAPLL